MGCRARPIIRASAMRRISSCAIIRRIAGTYFPNMTPDEMLIWTGYDSDPSMPSIVPHGAFDDPNCNDPNAIRSNIDTRVYVFFDD